MPAIRVYRCTRCKRGKEEGITRELLMVKKVQFLEMGEGGATRRSRVVDWLCARCVAADEDWQREAFVVPKDTIETVHPVPAVSG